MTSIKIVKWIKNQIPGARPAGSDRLSSETVMSAAGTRCESLGDFGCRLPAQAPESYTNLFLFSGFIMIPRMVAKSRTS